MDVLAELLGQAPSVAALRGQIRLILARASQARRFPPILLEGETGTGKNLVASVIHRSGARAGGPFVDVNCAAIPEGLLEAELFGFERGAFTDARRPKAGLFQTAGGGTIFLDEIALLSEALQAKLLKVIEERTIRRLGSTTSEPVDVSIIAATNDDLAALVGAHRFRQDLYHRLKVLTLRLPPLRERLDDVVILAEHFLARATKDYGLPPKVLTPAARHALRGYGWPGNVRELANVLERAALLSETPSIGPDMLALPSPNAPGGVGATVDAPPGASLGARIEALERQELLRALDETRWKVARAAVRLGITRGTIRYRIAKHGLEPPTRRARRRPRQLLSVVQPPPSSAVTAPAVARWEQRLVALLQAELRPLDGDDLRAGFVHDLDLLVQKVESFGGRIEDAGPARIVAAFGVDPAEDAPRRAALAGMAIQNALGRFHPPRRSRVTVTVGIHADQCPVAEVGGQARVDADAKSRMLAQLELLVAGTESDAVLVTRGTRPLLGPRFDVEGGRLRAYHQHRFVADGQPGQFVGREPELAALHAQWQEARQGRGRIVAVVGEPGIGKTRLIFELARALAPESLTRLEGRGESYGGGVPYRPVIDLLKGYLQVEERDDPSATAEKVRGRLLSLDPALASDASPLLALLGAPVGDVEWDAFEPAQRRQRTLDALKRLVLGVAQTQPVLLVIEDLHWIDAETQAFLDRLVVSVSAARLLVLVSCRPEYRASWGSLTSYTQLHLEPLPSESAKALVRGLVGADALLEPLRQILVERTEGNPFFLEESVLTLVETGALIGERGAYRPAQAVERLQVPPTVRAVLATRIDRLAPVEKHVVQAAAVVGKNVPFALLRAVADVPEAALRDALANLQVAEFLRETQIFTEVEYAFKHALTHDVVYETLLPDRRRAVHARMVEALERFYADRLTEQVEQLAHHALAAELWPKAVAYSRQAGVKAAWRSAHLEAIPHFDRALRAIRRLPQTEAILREMLDLYLRLRWSLVPLGEYGKLAESLREAAALVERLGDQRELAELSQSMTNYLRQVGDCDGALVAGERARTIAVALGDKHLEIRTTYQLGYVYRQLGDYPHAIRMLRGVVDALAGELMYERFGEPSVLSVHARAWLAAALAEVGDFDDGIVLGEEAIQIAESAGNAFSLTAACTGLGALYVRRGCVGEATRILERGLSLCREGNFNLLLPGVASELGVALALAGRVSHALPLLELSREVATSRGLMAGCGSLLVRLGRARLLAGDVQGAREGAVRALEAARRYKERGAEARALHLLGEISAHGPSPDVATAIDHYAQTLTLAGALRMRPLVAHCHLGLGKLYRRTGKREQAQEHLTTATTMYREMGMTYWLERAEAAMSNSGLPAV
jgi:DNA-binding NtrC family response regulator/tetratricopeptide (TPR) repeat protein